MIEFIALLRCLFSEQSLRGFVSRKIVLVGLGRWRWPALMSQRTDQGAHQGVTAARHRGLAQAITCGGGPSEQASQRAFPAAARPERGRTVRAAGHGGRACRNGLRWPAPN